MKWKPTQHVPATSTLEAMTDRHLQNEWPIPSEIARPLEIENPPTLDGQKLLKYMMFKSGPHLSDRNTTHSFYLSDINDHPGFKHQHNLKSMEKICKQLQKFIVTTRNDIHFDSGVILQHAKSSSNSDGRVVISYIFGEKFIKLVQESEIYTLIDCSSIFYFENKYSMAIYDFIASIYKIQTYHSHKMTLLEFRKMIGLPKDKYPDFSELKRRIIDPSMEDIKSHVHNFSLRYDTERTGMKTTHIEFFFKNLRPQQTDNEKAMNNPFIPAHTDSKSSTKFYLTFPFDIKEKSNDSWREYCTQKLEIKNYTHFHTQFKMYAKDMKLSLFHPNIQIEVSDFAKQYYDPDFKIV